MLNASYLPTITAAIFCRGLISSHTTGAGSALAEEDVCIRCPRCFRSRGRCGTQGTRVLIQKHPVLLLWFSDEPAEAALTRSVVPPGWLCKPGVLEKCFQPRARPDRCAVNEIIFALRRLTQKESIFAGFDETPHVHKAPTTRIAKPV